MAFRTRPARSRWRAPAIRTRRKTSFSSTSNDNTRLDTAGGGYAVFGKVIDGMDVVNKIARVETARQRGMDDVPVEPVVIKTARRKVKK